MHTRVLRPGDLGPAERDIWGADSPPRRPVARQSVSHTRVRRRGRRCARRRRGVAVVEDSGQPVGYLRSPRRKTGPVHRSARRSATRERSSRTGSSGIRPSSVRDAGMTSWSFDHLVATQQPFARFHRELHSSPLVDLASGHDAYLADVRARSKDVLAQVARRRRKLGREVGDVLVEWRTTTPRRSTPCSRGSRRNTARRVSGIASISRGSSTSYERWRRPRATASPGCSAPCAPASTSSPCTSASSDAIGSCGGSRAYDADYGSYSTGPHPAARSRRRSCRARAHARRPRPGRAPLQAPGGERCLRRRRRCGGCGGVSALSRSSRRWRRRATAGRG